MFRTLLVVAFAMWCSGVSSAQNRPNVLLICIDDLKPQIGCYGDKLAVTPNIDRLASHGTLFHSAYCNQAVCSPSRNALLTSLRPQTLGIYDLPTHFRKAKPDAITMPQHFKSHGYTTQGLGKIFHVGHGNIDDAQSWSVPSWRPGGPAYALQTSTEETKTKANGKDKGNATESADVPDETYADGKVAAEAIRRLDQLQHDSAPFFLAVGFVKPHLPFVAPKKYWDQYDPNQIPLPMVSSPPQGAPAFAPTNSGELWAYADMPSKGPLPESRIRHLLHGYLAATSYTDAQIGKVLNYLDKSGLSKNTIVVLWGDHGWHLGDHGMWCKHTNYEQATRIPLIVSLPGQAKAATTSAMVESVDVFPTLSELAGIPTPTSLDGRSFASTLKQSDAKARDYITHVYPRGQILGRAIRDARYRMVEWKEPGSSPDSAEIELYDYQSDPLETTNLASKHPDVVQRMRKILATHPEAKPQLKATEDKQEEKPAKKQDRNAMFEKRDQDKDGFLTRQEFLINQPDPDQAPDRFLKFDQNKDGKLSREEFVKGGTSK